ncbi:MAG: NAD kinase [Flavobacteriales bacterium]|nr:NAD kinase [Flavobacteriales bacterium]|tara:strand:- start:4139 stop:5014 length:876 start_codon:yes stop_codon:yes gene_type:complete
MRIALFGTQFNYTKLKYIQHLVNKLEKENIELIIESQFHDNLVDINFKNKFKIFKTSKELKDNADILLSIGGDGTLLAAITFVKNSDIPILGINTGTLGFISSVSTDQIEYAINHLLKGEYKIKKRTLLQLESLNNLFGETNFALNEVTVLKKDTSSMIRIHAYLDDEFINTYWADGLIISSPTGSTGYSLSCGGPIVLPGTNNFIITPIAPHNLNVRPIIVSDESKITLKVSKRDEIALVALDSRSRAIGPELELTIRKANYKVKLIQFEKQSFISTIREKLMWGKDKRN